MVGKMRNVGMRYMEHKARATITPGVDDLDSDLYRLYPSKQSEHLGKGMRRGYFEDLELLCGLCFTRDVVQYEE